MSGAAASGALVLALALALTSGTAPMQPVASAPPPPPPAAPAPAPRPPAPLPPEPERPQAPAPRPAPPAPATPQLDAHGPTKPLTLVPGGDPVALPINVANSGTGPSEPVTAILTLPPGVSSEIPGVTTVQSGPAGTAPASARTSAARAAEAAASGPPVRCEGWTGGVQCTSERGLNPGEQLTFDLHTTAAANATGGEISARILAGADLDLPLSAIQVKLRSGDGVDVALSTTPHPVHDLLLGDDIPEGPPLRLLLDVRNTGVTRGRAEAVTHLPDGAHALGIPRSARWCRRTTSCTARLSWTPASPTRARCG
ncbi:hypothetical protein [Saccharopolyspora gloriosae]|uniref:hypothetical protein n=1 Tax=Saccharopolyspora gloriosae TaxID=455344 RepID=UPI001FB74A01|nr:hypothetical protein [Saccharopolyspora gloriosae]